MSICWVCRVILVDLLVGSASVLFRVLVCNEFVLFSMVVSVLIVVCTMLL